MISTPYKRHTMNCNDGVAEFGVARWKLSSSTGKARRRGAEERQVVRRPQCDFRRT